MRLDNMITKSRHIPRPSRFVERILRRERFLPLSGFLPADDRSASIARLPVRLLKRMLGPTRSQQLGSFIGKTQAALRKRRSFPNIKNLRKHKDAYLANALTSLGSHSPYYGACATKPAPVERCDFQLIAYYLPQYHPIPENDRWWGAGFTEWRNVSRAFPVFVGHDQPRYPGELGYYDLRVPEVMRRQVELAKLHGISAFCFHFYWFGGKRLLELPLEHFLQNTDLDLKFCLCWANENWTRRWDGADHEILLSQSHSPEDDVAFIQYLDKYFSDARYLKIDGKPILTVYRPGILPDAKATTDRWRMTAKEAGYPGIYLIATDSFGFSQYKALGFDALSEFPPHGFNIKENNAISMLHPQFKGKVYSYEDAYDCFAGKLLKSDKTRIVFPGVMPSWDNTARRPLGGNVFHGSTPTLFYGWLMDSIRRTRANAAQERLIFINAWNEWAEGAYLEPDRKFGYAYLAACAASVSDTSETDPRVTALFKKQRDDFKPRHRRAVSLHLFYEDLAEWFSQRIHRFGEFDVYITVPRTIRLKDAIFLNNTFSSAYILEVDNRGRDILPFFLVYKKIIETKYDFICKLHSKKSPHLRNGDQWRTNVVDQLFSAQAREALDQFTSRSDVGLIVPNGALETLRDVNVRVRTENALLKMSRKLNYRITFTEPFVAGSMFWFKPQALEGLYRLFLEELTVKFEPELGQVDGTLAHAIERIFCIAALTAGMTTIEFGENPVRRPSQWA